jgi:signal transduction histidine kinase
MGVDLDLVARRKDGSEFPADISLAPFRPAGGAAGGTGDGGALVVSAIRDLTERRRAEAERARLLGEQETAAAVQRERQLLLDGVVHDLKSPLAAVLGALQLLDHQHKTGEVPAAFLDRQLRRLLSAAGRLQAELDSLTQLAAASRTAPPAPSNAAAPPVTDLVALARELIAAQHLDGDQAAGLAGAADAAGQQPAAGHAPAQDGADPEPAPAHYPRLRLVLDAPPAGLLVAAAAAPLARVLDNLLGNAVKYSPAGGTIVVRLTQAPDAAGRQWAVLQVRDDGVGIPAADLPRIFEPFRRGANVGPIAGTGIGLATVRQLVEAQGGTVAVASTEGKGSTFTVTLPLPPEPAGGAAAGQPAAPDRAAEAT